ncbi:MAG: DNA repair protein RecO [Ruminococcaceae bacterium]|nr:DNA repair protein RecO [Oscillospiraceae bacterium]
MYKTVNGLVLKRTRFNDSHAYIKVLTDTGLLTFLAFGVMSPKNKNFSATEPYTVSEFVLTVKGENLTLSQATTIRHLIKQGADFEMLSLANYVTSLASDTAFDDSDAKSIYSLTCLTLNNIMQKKADMEIIKAVFELKLVSSLGFYPDFSRCFVCHREVEIGSFLTSEGAPICDKCNVTKELKGIPVTKSLLSNMEKLLEMPDRQAFGIRFSDPLLQSSFTLIAENFSTECLDCGTDALRYYKENIKNF